MNKVFASLVVGAVLLVGPVGTASANTPRQTSVQEQISSAGPSSFRMFCGLNPGECMPGGASKITLNQQILDTVAAVNARVNRSIRPRLDSAYLQMWRVNPRSGDCKSYVVTKRHQLVAAGLPASALRIAYVKTRAGQGHAVLVIKTNQGDLALDNLTGEIKTFRQTGYRLVAMSQADPKRWS